MPLFPRITKDTARYAIVNSVLQVLNQQQIL